MLKDKQGMAVDDATVNAIAQSADQLRGRLINRYDALQDSRGASRDESKKNQYRRATLESVSSAVPEAMRAALSFMELSLLCCNFAAVSCCSPHKFGNSLISLSSTRIMEGQKDAPVQLQPLQPVSPQRCPKERSHTCQHASHCYNIC